MDHVPVIVKLAEASDGILAVTVRCCGDPKTDSVLSLHELGRTEEEIDQDIEAHKVRVAKLHADKQRLKAHLERLSGIASEDCECR